MDWINTGESDSHPLAATICLTAFQYSLVFLPGLITGRLFDVGIFKLPFFLASVAVVVATFLVAECTVYWQFLLCQGFAIGVSISSQTLSTMMLKA